MSTSHIDTITIITITVIPITHIEPFTIILITIVTVVTIVITFPIVIEHITVFYTVNITIQQNITALLPLLEIKNLLTNRVTPYGNHISTVSDNITNQYGYHIKPIR